MTLEKVSYKRRQRNVPCLLCYTKLRNSGDAVFISLLGSGRVKAPAGVFLYIEVMDIILYKICPLTLAGSL